MYGVCARDCDLLVVGRNPNKLAILQKRGIRVQTTDEKLEPGADIVVEATGNAEGFVTARRIVRPRGKLVLKAPTTATCRSI